MLRNSYRFRSLLFLLIFVSININANDELQSIFIKGADYSLSGQYDKAATEYRKMLAIDSSLPRPRLELAYVLFKNGDYEGSRYHFEKVLASVKSPSVKNNIRTFLNQIREELPQFNLTFGIIKDSNPSQETSSKKVMIGGFEFELASTDKDKSDIGYEVKLDSKIPLNNKDKTFIKANIEHTDYSGTNNAKTYLSASYGKHMPLSLDSSITPKIGHHKFIYKSNSLYGGNTLGLDFFKRIDNKSSIEFGASLLDYNYPDYSHMDGLKKSMVLQYSNNPSSNNQYKFQASKLLSDAKDKSIAFSQTGLLINNVRDISNGWVVGLTGKVNNKKYQKTDPFFGVIRDDKEITVETSIVNTQYEMYGLSPRLVIGKTDNKSNIPLYEFDRTYSKIEFTKEF